MNWTDAEQYDIEGIPPQFENFLGRWMPEMIWNPFDPENDIRAILAGGMLRSFYEGKRPNDADFYFENEQDFDYFIAEYEAQDQIQRRFETDRAVSLINRRGFMVQAIRYFWIEDILEALDRFDFTIAKIAISETVLYIHREFFRHLATKELHYTGSELPLAALKRTLKFVHRGFRMCDENLIKVAEDIADVVHFDQEQELERHMQTFDPEGDRRILPID